jgi:hypothetical protein
MVLSTNDVTDGCAEYKEAIAPAARTELKCMQAPFQFAPGPRGIGGQPFSSNKRSDLQPNSVSTSAADTLEN